MLSRKHKQEVVAPMAPLPSLADRMAELHSDIEKFIDERVAEIRADGVPREVLKQMLAGGSTCWCRIASRVIADRAKESEIAARQS
jgi:hypothetical protein